MEVVDFDDEKITIEKDGKEVECDVLFTFESEDTMKGYIGYTDNSIAPNGRKNIYVTSYNSLDPEIKFEDITDQRQLEMINDVLKQIDEEANS